MIPIVTPEQMAAIDASATEPIQSLIARAGWAVMRNATQMLGGGKKCIGKSILVIAGKGNNGADGIYAAELLAARGFLVSVQEASKEQQFTNEQLRNFDLIIDAAYGTGLKGEYFPPQGSHLVNNRIQILAVDIPSGVDGSTGEIQGGALKANRTITFGALKPGHILYPGSSYTGKIRIDPIGLDTSSVAKAWQLNARSVAEFLPSRQGDAHKWQSACWLVGGSPGMKGAASLMAKGAYRSGAGYVRVSTLGGNLDLSDPLEAVGYTLPAVGWSDVLLRESHRFKAVALGPGIDEKGPISPKHELASALVNLEKPLVLDGGGLNLLADVATDIGPQFWWSRKGPTILTPHDKEFERLNGSPPTSDRFNSVRELAQKYKSIVLLKGPTTIVADPSGNILVSRTGDERLASAGAGDVLTGIITGFLAQGMEPQLSAAVGAYIHGVAAKLGHKTGLMASDVANLVPEALQKFQKA